MGARCPHLRRYGRGFDQLRSRAGKRRKDNFRNHAVCIPSSHVSPAIPPGSFRSEQVAQCSPAWSTSPSIHGHHSKERSNMVWSCCRECSCCLRRIFKPFLYMIFFFVEHELQLCEEAV